MRNPLRLLACVFAFAALAISLALSAPVGATTVDLSDIAAAPRSAIAGSWYVTTSQGYSFVYVLTAEWQGVPTTADQTPILVKGQIVSRDQIDGLNGGLQGQMPAGSRTLTYEFSQNDGSKGTGKVTLSANGRSLEGAGRSGRQRYTIDGARMQ